MARENLNIICEAAYKRGLDVICEAEESGELYKKFSDACIAAMILRNADEERAKRCFEWCVSVAREGMSPYDLCNFLIAARKMGYSGKIVDQLRQSLERRYKDGAWYKDVWLNAYAIRTLGEYGICIPSAIDSLIKNKNRLPDGSWFRKVWVTSYGLMAMYYGGEIFKDEMEQTIRWIKERRKMDGYWDAETSDRGIVSRETVTSIASQALLLVGEGYEDPFMSKCLEWLQSRINTTQELSPILGMMIPFSMIRAGEACRHTTLKVGKPIQFKEIKVEQRIEKMVETEIHGDVIKGVKIGEGAIVQRSSIDTSGETEIGSTCPQCGAAVREAYQYCPMCGARIQRTRE